LLNVHNKIANTNTKSLGNPPQGNQGNVFLSALNAPDIIWVKIGLFSQPFLRQMNALPLFADGCTEENAIIRWRHNIIAEQKLAFASTPLNG
jgi:hypothetical protein